MPRTRQRMNNLSFLCNNRNSKRVAIQNDTTHTSLFKPTPKRLTITWQTPSLHTTTPPTRDKSLPDHETLLSTNTFESNKISFRPLPFPLPIPTITTPPFFNDPTVPSTVPQSENTHFEINVFSCHVETTITPIPSPTPPLSTRCVDTNTQSRIPMCDSSDFDENNTSAAFRVTTPMNLLEAISNDTSF
ncbi:hypothetical protein BLNAU_14852 [Blattamonas nauphoetae]|uniref:Uncharacterized protein n=1 Tax=Blattamonas nauphoetae TaxID=2049346 RepID=A0ABQ9XCC2_9EUKA|nr:hypothetical protein BLNAU_14852 [Blattamonas nauphoetae]